MKNISTKIFRRLLQAAMFLFSAGIHAQNLVPNGDFELYDTCPSPLSWISYANNWYSPTQASPDYYNDCDQTGTYGCIQNIAGGGGAHSGSGMSGIIAFNPSSFIRDYIQVQLSSPLVSGIPYHVEWFVSLADSCIYSISDIGALLSALPAGCACASELSFVPQVLNPSDSLLDNKTGWTKISGTYTASGGEQYLTIGNFSNNVMTHDSITASGSFTLSYYFIDDVRLIADSLNEIRETENSLRLRAFPNPATTKLLVESPGASFTQLRILNSQGKILAETSFAPALIYEFDSSELASGFYFVQVYASGCWRTLKFVRF